MKTISITPYCELPVLGFGTWKIPSEVTQLAVLTALHAGYTHLDCAYIYGNEVAVGKGISQFLRSEGGVRQRLWVTSKLWNADHLPQRVRAACLQTLLDLGLDYLDLYLIHWPVAFREGVLWPEKPGDVVDPEQTSLSETWAAMEDLVKEGFVRSIGVSNFSIPNLERILMHAKIRPAVNQIECHPYLPQRELADWCIKHNIHVTAHSPLGSADRPEWLKHDQEVAVLNDPMVASIAAVHSVTPAQVLLAWHMGHGRSVVCKTVSCVRLLENLLASQLTLDAKDVVILSDLNTRQRYINPVRWFESDTPVSSDQVWNNTANDSAQQPVLP